MNAPTAVKYDHVKVSYFDGLRSMSVRGIDTLVWMNVFMRKYLERRARARIYIINKNINASGAPHSQQNKSEKNNNSHSEISNPLDIFF